MEKVLLALGAETVCGDLILNRVTVGMYREGVFIPTPEGKAAADAAEATGEKTKPAKTAPVTGEEVPVKPAKAPRKGKKADAPTEDPEPASETPTDDAGALDDLLAGTGLDDPK